MTKRLRSFLVGGLGIGLVLVGLSVLAFNGYVEDYGAEPLRTWQIAVPIVSIGIVLLVALGGRRSLISALPIVAGVVALKLLAPSLPLPGLALVALGVILAVRDAERGRTAAGGQAQSTSRRVPAVAVRTERGRHAAEHHGSRPRSPQPVDGVPR